MAQHMEIVSVRPGKEKPVYIRIGAMFPAKDGKEGYTIKLDAIPLPNEKGEVWLMVRPPFEKDAPKGYSSAPKSAPVSRAPQAPILDDEVPF
jgi:hypothetical protein